MVKFCEILLVLVGTGENQSYVLLLKLGVEVEFDNFNCLSNNKACTLVQGNIMIVACGEGVPNKV